MCDMPTRVAPWGVGLLLFTVSACGGADDDAATRSPSGGWPQLVMPGTPNDIEVQMPAKPGESFVHGAHPICLDEPGQIDVTSIEFVSGDLKITDWAVKPGPTPDSEGRTELVGDYRSETLESLGIEQTQPLTRVCDGQSNFYEVALQLRAGESSTHGDDVVVRYTSDGREGSLELPERVVLCVRPDHPTCI